MNTPPFIRRLAALALVVVLGPGIAPALAADGAALEGQVVRAGSDAPVAGATVRLADPGSGAVVAARPTGADGRFRLAGVPAGTYALDVAADGGVYVAGATVALAPGASRFVNVEIGTAPRLAPAASGSWPRAGTTLLVIGGAILVGAAFDSTFNPDTATSPSIPD